MKASTGGKDGRFVGLLMVLIAVFFVFPYPSVLKAAKVPSVEDIIRGKANLPTIEDLTAGKVKVGDLINKDNVDLVKKYLSPAIYETVRQGMALRMGTQIPADRLNPGTYTDATLRNQGKAIIDENGTIYYEKMGVPWPGGLPIIEPKTGMEVMASAKFGYVWDDLWNTASILCLINSKGEIYKRYGQEHRFTYCNTRTKVPPFGTIPGYEDIMYKRVVMMTSPLELKGLGQYVVRYYDDAKTYDTGFAYLPAFKRTIRVSSTTWQDNIAGSDMTYGDGQGLNEPYSDWKFKLVGKKYLLLPEPKAPFPMVHEDGKIDERVEYTVGKKFALVRWCIWPVHVVEAIPKAKHIYGKKILHVHAWPYISSATMIPLADIYDRQMKLWKFYLGITGYHYIRDGEPYSSQYAFVTYDLQVGHMTWQWALCKLNWMNWQPEDLTLKTLLQVGR